METVLKLYERVIQLQPGDSDSYYNRAVTYHGVGNVAGAAADYRAALSLAPTSPKAVPICNNYGALLRNQGKVKEAEQLYRHALAQNPSHGKSHYNIGILHQAAGREQESRHWYKAAAALDPTLPVP
jgi:Tfp pilus assembly protein PilF